MYIHLEMFGFLTFIYMRSPKSYNSMRKMANEQHTIDPLPYDMSLGFYPWLPNPKRLLGPDVL